jgi:hypothetical protein
MKTVRRIVKNIRHFASRQKIKTLFVKRKKFVFISAALVFIALSGITIAFLNIRNQAQNHVTTTTENIPSQSKISTLPDSKAPTLSNKEKTESKKPDTSGEPGAVENTVEPGPVPGNYVTPDFHIRTPLSMTVNVGGQVGPFIAYTSDGSLVDWQTPDTKDGTDGVYGYMMNPMPQYSKKMEYYIHANDDAKPGTYYLYISAHKNQNPPMMSSIQLKVTVTPSPTFLVDVSWKKYTIYGDIVSIPYTIRRFNGFNEDISMMAYYHDPYSSDPVGSGYNVTIPTSVTSGIIKMYLPDGKIKVTVQASNPSGQNMAQDSFTISKTSASQ